MAQQKGQGKGGDRGGSQNQRPIIIVKKKKRGGHEAHHGGAWKVAYADFVTAMMAFFLLLWLLNVTTSDQRNGIADYFSPVSVSRNTSGSGGVLGGRTLTAPGALLSASSPLAPQRAITGAPGAAAVESRDPDADDPNEPDYQPERSDLAAEFREKLQQMAAELGLPGDRPVTSVEDFARRVAMMRVTYPAPRPDENRLDFQRRLEDAARRLGQPGQQPGESLAVFAQRLERAAEGEGRTAADQIARQDEARRFQEAAQALRAALMAQEDLKQLANAVLVDETPQGLRIQIVDDTGQALFPNGSSQMYPRTRALLRLIGQVIGPLPNRITISGHTDSRPFRLGAVRDNWDLSAERANASRRALMEAGVLETRFATVVGRADRELLVTDDPLSPRNRRISIVIHRETALPPVPAPGETGDPG